MKRSIFILVRYGQLCAQGLKSAVAVFVCILILDLTIGAPLVAQGAPRIGDIQESLIWTGHYDGLINGRLTDYTKAAIRSYQRDMGLADDGQLDPNEIEALRERGTQRQLAVGFAVEFDSRTGIQIGLPKRLVAAGQQTPIGTNWAAPDDSINIDTFAFFGKHTLHSLYAKLHRAAFGRRVEYTLLKNDWFVLEGQDADGRRFYVRAQSKGSDIRAFSVTYPSSNRATAFPIIIAMSNSFTPFPEDAPQEVAPPPPPPPDKKSPGEACRVFPELCQTS